MSTVPGVLSIEEFEQLPDRDGIQELLDGALIEMPPPKRRHSEIVKNVVARLKAVAGESRVWPETGFLIGGHCPQPDVAVIHPGQGTERDWFAGAPMVAIEVASRGNTPDELEFKKNLYLAHGAVEVWIVYDKTRTVVVHSGNQSVSYSDTFMSISLGAAFRVAEILAPF